MAWKVEIPGVGWSSPVVSTELKRFARDSASVRSYHPALYGEHDTKSWSLGLGFGYSRMMRARSSSVEPSLN